MGLSAATVTPANMQLTPMRVKFNGVDLGGTAAGVEILPKIEYADVMADQFGKTPLDKKVSGYAFLVKFELVEVQLKDNWKLAFPSAKLEVGASKSLYTDLQIGDGLLARAQQLLIHPLDHLDSDLTGDLLFYKAANVGAPQLKYNHDKQLVLAVEMVIFPDTSVSPPRLMLYGDPAIGLIAASAGAPVAGVGNVGNGTVGTVTVTSGVTKTETITLTALSATKFGVQGGVTGALGVATVGSAFLPPSGTPQVIGFTITAGGTAFSAGDTFTIATTSANYT